MGVVPCVLTLFRAARVNLLDAVTSCKQDIRRVPNDSAWYTPFPVQQTYYVLLAVGIIVAIVFALLVFLTGKGDAMGGSSGVRTTFKGKAGFDDFISKATLILGISFMALMLILDIINAQITRHPTA